MEILNLSVKSIPFVDIMLNKYETHTLSIKYCKFGYNIKSICELYSCHKYTVKLTYSNIIKYKYIEILC